MNRRNKQALATGKKLKHISQLDPTNKARAQQRVQDALLAIIAQQGRQVRIPLHDMDLIAGTHILKLEVIDDCLVLTTERISHIAVPDKPVLNG